MVQNVFSITTGWKKSYSPASSTLDEEREPLMPVDCSANTNGYIASSATTLADIMGKDDDDDDNNTNHHHHDEILPLTAFVESNNIPSSRRVFHGSSPFIERFRQFRANNREFLAEFIGTLVLILLIDGVSAEQTLNSTGPKSWLTSSFGTGLAVLFAISVSGHISGAHINPAVTLTFWAFSGFPTRKVPIYMTAQFLGAFVGAALLYSVIYPALYEFDGGNRQILGDHGTAGIFATYPPLYVGTGAAIASEIIGTAFLLLLIMVTGHPNNMPFHQSQGVMIATGLMIISMSLGYTSGFSLNPARDMGPRVFTAIAGWGTGVFSIRDYYSFIPMFAPYVGGLVGGLVYTIFIDHI